MTICADPCFVQKNRTRYKPACYFCARSDNGVDDCCRPLTSDFSSWRDYRVLRAGPGCLNRISASISGASAGVRPPRGAEEDRSRLDPGCDRQGSNADGGHCTTTFENAHRTVLREVLYRYHPWFGRRVSVHGTVDKADDVA